MEKGNINPATALLIEKNTNDNVKNLYNYLKDPDFITGKGDPKTTYIDVLNSTTYNICGGTAFELFEYLEKIRENGSTMHFNERQESEGKICSGIMLDFDIYQRSKTREVTIELFSNLTKIINKILMGVIDFENSPKKSYHIFFIQRAGVTPAKGGESYKDGFHVLIPELWVEKFVKKHLINELKSCMTKLFKDVSYTQSAEDILDNNSASVPVTLYGSCKVGNKPYTYTTGWEIKIDYSFGGPDIERNLVELPKCNLVSEFSLTGTGSWLDKMAVPIKEELYSTLKNKYDRKVDIYEDLDDNINNMIIKDPKFELISQLTDSLDDSYVNDYDKWFKVLCVIKNTSIKFKELAICFSQRSSKYDESGFIKTWNSIIPQTSPSIRSLMYWVKECNPERFKMIQFHNHQRIIQDELIKFDGNLEHASIAKILYLMQKHKYVCAEGVDVYTGKKGYCWYKYCLPDDKEVRYKPWLCHKWVQIKEPFELSSYLYEELPYALDPTVEYARFKESQNDENVKYYQSLQKNIKNTKRRLGNDTFQNGCIKQARKLFYSMQFESEINSYIDVIGVKNGILHLGKCPKLIKGFNEYKLTETLKIPYIARGKDPENDILVDKLEKSFRDIIPEEDAFKFIMCYLSKGLDKDTPPNINLELVGGGSNGKTFIFNMWLNTLACFGSPLDPNLFLPGTISPDRPNPAKMVLKGLRGGVADEFNEESILDGKCIKQTTGNIKITGRGLFSGQEVFDNTAVIILASNYDFRMINFDHGLWRRICYYRCKIKFCENPDPDNPHEKKEDLSLGKEVTKDTKYHVAMLTLLVHYYSILQNEYGGNIEKISIPTIKRETLAFRNRQDTINHYITEMLDVDPESKIHVADLLAHYGQWYKTNISSNDKRQISVILDQFKNSTIKKAFSKDFLEGYSIRKYAK